ncbi:hypothetical protein V5799_031904 [Amblyomma americanum]|uniref:Uncharacterized protein n=1 Tax=Amblyomma americanum TaxID=6943 RepID=A0AAQ4DSP8_AMBAM
MLTTMDIPARFQRATEKAAGLYRACVSLASNPKGYQMSINNEDEDWMETSRRKFNGLTLNLFYMKYLYIYDRHLDSDPIVERILRAERVDLPPSALASAARLTENVVQTLMKKLNDTEWIQGSLWCMMHEKAQQLRVMLAYPEAVGTESLIDDFFREYL